MMAQPQLHSNESVQSSQTVPVQNPENTLFGHQYESGILMHHVSTPPSIVSNIRIGPVNFQRRTVDGSRLFRENFNQVFDEIRPFVEQARTSLLNRQMSQNSQISLIEQNDTVVTSAPSSSSVNVQNSQNTDYVITVDSSQPSPDSNGPPTNNVSRHNSIPESYFTPPPTNNNNAEDSVTVDALRQVPEARALLETFQKYVPFVLILLAKAVYDHHEGILNLIALFITFSHANSVLKREVGKQARRSISSLLLVLVYIIGCMVFINYIFNDDKLYPSLVFMPPYTPPGTVWDLLWTVSVMDFMLKLITIILKILLTMIPATIIPYQRRGKIYLFCESISQLYRSLLPIQPWLWFMLDSYHGAERITGVFLFAAYMVAKGADLAARLKLLKTACIKLIQNVTIGTAANKEQLRTAGEQCPICHDSFNEPVALQPCRHIFCEACVCAWLDREPTCPLCRAMVSDDPAWRDAATSYFIQLY